MGLTISGPLTARRPPRSNYEIEGPRHRILWDGFPRRVRAELAGQIVLDTSAGHLLHESQILPVLYAPRADIRMELFEPTTHSTHCPFKGDAAYWSVRVGERIAENAVWSYPEPNPETDWLRDHYAFYWSKLDRWFDEDEEVHGHLRDPYHRVDVRRGSRAISATIDGVRVAASSRPWVVSETGMANRIYFPRSDVELSNLRAAEKRTHCPYKGDAGYLSLVDATGSVVGDEIAWSYEQPLDDAARIAGAICFDGERVSVEPDQAQS